MVEILKQKIMQRKKIIIIVSVILILIICYFLNSNDKHDFIDSEEILENTSEKAIETADTIEPTDEDVIYVHIAGSVKNPGVVSMAKGSRIEDAIKLAGGLDEDADITNVNLAFVLEDGMKIRIPSINDEEESEYIITDSGKNVMIDSGTATKNVDDSNQKNEIVNINTASQTELETLSGIGPSLASKIIAYREEHGNFKSIEEIKNVSGIGDSKFKNIKDFITVK